MLLFPSLETKWKYHLAPVEWNKNKITKVYQKYQNANIEASWDRGVFTLQATGRQDMVPRSWAATTAGWSTLWNSLCQLLAVIGISDLPAENKWHMTHGTSVTLERFGKFDRWVYERCICCFPVNLNLHRSDRTAESMPSYLGLTEARN